MTSKGLPELDYIFNRRTGRGVHFNVAGLRLLWAFGLGMPRMSTKEEIVTERGVFQHGSTVVMLKLPPTREWGLVMEIAGPPTRQQYWDIRQEALIRIFNPAEATDCGFTDTPTPHRYTKVLPNGERRHLDFFYRSGLEFNEPPTDGMNTRVTARLVSPDVTLYGDIEETDYNLNTYLVDINGTIIPPPAPPPVLDSVIRFIGDDTVDANLVENFGSWCSGPRLEFTIDPNGRADYRLKRIVIFNQTDGTFHTFDHIDASSWGPFTFSGFGDEKIIFDVATKQLIREYQATADPLDIVQTQLQLQATETTDWANYNMLPQDSYVFGIDFVDEAPAANVRLDGFFLSWVPRFLGI